MNKKITNKAKRGSTKQKINYKVGYLTYVAYNKEGLNHVLACMCQYGCVSLKAQNPWKNQGKL